MLPKDLKAWRVRMGLTQEGAAEELGVSVTTMELYERGIRRDSDQPVTIPRSVELACAALTLRFAAERNNVLLLSPEVRQYSQHVMYLLSLPTFEAAKGGKGKSFPTKHAALRDAGFIPKSEPSLLEQIFPLASASKLRDLMHELDRRSATAG